MTTQTEITPATKAQLDALIELCLGDPKYHEAAGFLKLASDIISEKVCADEKYVCVTEYGYPDYNGAILDDSTAWDKERDELRTMGQGG